MTQGDENSRAERRATFAAEQAMLHEPAAAELQRALSDRMLLEHLPEVVCVLDRAQRVKYLSRTVPGRNVEEMLGRRANEFVRPEHLERFNATFERVWCERKPESIDYVSQAGGFWQTQLVPIHEHGEVVRVLASSLEISDRVREQSARRESDSRLRHATELVGMGTWTHEWKSDELVWDDALCKIFGVHESPRNFAQFMALVHPDDRARLETAALRGHETGEYDEIEYRIVRPRGEERLVRAKGSLQVDAQGRAFGSIGAVFDVTVRKRLEEQVYQRQKLEAVGELTAGIAHNFNNLLSIILPNVGLCLEDAPPALAQCLGDIEHATLRAADLVRQLMLFVRHDPEAKKTAIDPHATLERVVRICRTTFDRNIGLELEADPHVPHIFANSAQLEQVLLNICINARDALRDSQTASPRIAIKLERCEAGVRVRVRDNGPGMSEQTRARVFEPFFTTKLVGRGTGLGLATAYAIVRDHGGRVRCESQLGRGTLFEIELPAAVTQSPASEPAPQRARLSQGHETILIVDDEALVRRATRAMLVRRGYRVLECSDGNEALAFFETHRAEIDLIVLDQSMPGLSGAQVLSRLRVLSPQVAVVLLSGQPFPNTSLDLADAALIKPVNMETLLHTIRGALEHISA